MSMPMGMPDGKLSKLGKLGKSGKLSKLGQLGKNLRNYSERCNSNEEVCLQRRFSLGLYDEVITWAKGKLRSGDFANGVLNSYGFAY